jgi:pyrroline-5-carboxylate reductase
MTTISFIGSGNMATAIGTRAAKHCHTIEVYPQRSILLRERMLRFMVPFRRASEPRLKTDAGRTETVIFLGQPVLNPC